LTNGSRLTRLMNLLQRIKLWRAKQPPPRSQRHGALGEQAAKKHLCDRGLKYLAANFRSSRGEIDLVFWHGDCLVFVEVKTRSSEQWTRPAAAVNARKRRLLSKCALDYMRQIKNPPLKIRFDVVEVLLRDSVVAEVRHLPNSFGLSAPYRYG
jgi:putative endonuclease